MKLKVNSWVVESFRNQIGQSTPIISFMDCPFTKGPERREPRRRTVAAAAAALMSESERRFWCRRVVETTTND